MQFERRHVTSLGAGLRGRQRVLLVDDDQDLLRLLGLRLEGEGYAVQSAQNAETALARLNDYRPQLVISDLQMPGMHGLDLLDEIHRRSPSLPVIMLTGHGSIPEAVRATQRGAFDFLTKPVDSEALLALLRRALGLAGKTAALATEPEAWCREIITCSPRFKQALEDARQVAASDTSIMITGESGTGKELLARAIHRASPRRLQAFVAINCGAMPENLLESELFGHRKGSFTGALRDNPGLFRTASGGTLFLDEIGDMPLPLQVKLVRVLQERQVRPVGDTSQYPVDVRILSATHRDLKLALAQGRFREDLYYRLNVVGLHLPSLKQRSEDIPLLATYRLRQLAEKSGERPKVYAPEAMELLAAADWPGNVRHLFNVVEQNVAMTRVSVISARVVQKAIGHAATLPTFNEARDDFVRSYLTQLLQITTGNISHAARLADRNRSEFYKLLARHGLERDSFKVA